MVSSFPNLEMLTFSSLLFCGWWGLRQWVTARGLCIRSAWTWVAQRAPVLRENHSFSSHNKRYSMYSSLMVASIKIEEAILGSGSGVKSFSDSLYVFLTPCISFYSKLSSLSSHSITQKLVRFSLLICRVYAPSLCVRSMDAEHEGRTQVRVLTSNCLAECGSGNACERRLST